MRGDQEVFHNRQLTDDFHVLEGAHNALGDDVMHHIVVEPQHVAFARAVQDIAFSRLVKLRDAVEHCCLAGAVGADEAEDLSLFDVEAQAVHGPQAAEHHGEIVKPQADILGEVVLRALLALQQACLKGFQLFPVGFYQAVLPGSEGLHGRVIPCAEGFIQRLDLVLLLLHGFFVHSPAFLQFLRLQAAFAGLLKKFPGQGFLLSFLRGEQLIQLL